MDVNTHSTCYRDFMETEVWVCAESSWLTQQPPRPSPTKTTTSTVRSDVTCGVQWCSDVVMRLKKEHFTTKHEKSDMMVNISGAWQQSCVLLNNWRSWERQKKQQMSANSSSAVNQEETIFRPVYCLRCSCSDKSVHAELKHPNLSGYLFPENRFHTEQKNTNVA